MTTALKKIDEATIEATIELGASDLEAAVAKAETLLGEQTTIEGFRQGKAPRDVLIKHLKPEQVREEALNIVVTESLINLSRDENLDVLDHHDFSVKENTANKLIFKVTLALYPQVKLGNYKGLNIGRKDTTVSDEELDAVLKNIAQSRAIDGKSPELTDEFAKSLGQFASLQNLRDTVKSSLLTEKEDREKERVRIELLNMIVKNSTVPVPDRMIELQLDTMLANFDEELHSRELEMGPYLAHLKKTQDDLRKEWRPKAKEQMQMQLVMHAVARAENIGVEEDELEQSLEMQLQQYVAGRPGTETNDLKNIDLQKVKGRLYSFLLNQKIFAFLESHAIINTS